MKNTSSTAKMSERVLEGVICSCEKKLLKNLFVWFVMMLGDKLTKDEYESFLKFAGNHIEKVKKQYEIS